MSAGRTSDATSSVKTFNVLTRTRTGLQYRSMEMENPPMSASELTSLPTMSWMRFAKDLYDGRIEPIRILSDLERMKGEAEELRQLHAGSTTESEDTLSAKAKKERFDGQSWDSPSASPFYDVLREYKDVLPDEIPAELPQDKGIQHEIDLVPGLIWSGFTCRARRGVGSSGHPVWPPEACAYKPGRLNVVADALSRRPDYAVKTVDANRIGVESVSTPSLSLVDDVKGLSTFRRGASEVGTTPSSSCTSLSCARRTAAIRRSGRRCDPHRRNDYDLRMRIMFEYHDAPTAGHPGREKTYVLLTRDFYWNHQYKWVRKYAPLHSLPTPSECWQSISMDFVFGLPPDSRRRTGVVVFVDRFSKMAHLAAVPAEVTAVQTARLFVDMVFKHHGMPLDIVTDRDPRFTARFWQEVFTLLGTQLSTSTVDHPQTDGQTERVNRVLGDLLKSYTHSFQQWSDCLPMAEFAINNSVHASTGHTPFYVNAMRHPRLQIMLGMVASSLSGGGSTVASEQPQKSADTDIVSAMTTRRQTASRSRNETTNKNYESVQGTDGAQAGPAAGKNVVLNKPFSTQAMDFVQRRQAVIRFVQDAIAASVDRQKLNADNVGRGNTNEFEKGSVVLLAT
ncbi:hypothetical protein PC119_g24399 [Phytophthora cactorum]|nr:hypothetical protein PC119_g24399 [Phytophthora cactorum]